MKFKVICLVTIASLLLSFSGLTSKASAAFVPAGLNAGDTYQLAFVTSGTRNGASATIADYNAFVQAQAALNSSLTGANNGVNWKAIVSTASVDAKDNASLVAPVYRFDGTLISTTGPTIYSGSLNATISLTQFGISQADSFVWTGSNEFGVDNGAGAMGTGSPRVGIWGAQNKFWAIFTASNSGTLHPLYALSDVLTVPGSPVPEPASLAMWGVGAIGLVFAGRKRRQLKLAA